MHPSVGDPKPCGNGSRHRPVRKNRHARSCATRPRNLWLFNRNSDRFQRHPIQLRGCDDFSKDRRWSLPQAQLSQILDQITEHQVVRQRKEHRSSPFTSVLCRTCFSKHDLILKIQNLGLSDSYRPSLPLLSLGQANKDLR